MNLNSIGKYISLILRHKPEIIGITLDEHGWANVDELIEGVVKHKYKEFNREVLEELVSTNEKQRYSFNEDKTLIRANQGHSIPVDVEFVFSIEKRSISDQKGSGRVSGKEYGKMKFMIDIKAGYGIMNSNI